MQTTFRFRTLDDGWPVPLTAVAPSGGGALNKIGLDMTTGKDVSGRITSLFHRPMLHVAGDMLSVIRLTCDSRFLSLLKLDDEDMFSTDNGLPWPLNGTIEIGDDLLDPPKILPKKGIRFHKEIKFKFRLVYLERTLLKLGNDFLLPLPEECFDAFCKPGGEIGSSAMQIRQ